MPSGESAPVEASPSPSATPSLQSPPANINLSQACQGVRDVPKLERQANDAHVLAAYDDERAAERKIALVYYHCADSFAGRTDTRGRYVHDQSQLMYATWMFKALPKPAPDDALAQTSSVVATLQSTTQFTDVKAAASALAVQLPAPRPKLDSNACQASGFTDALQAWYSHLQSWASSYDGMVRAGNMKATFLTEVAYSASRGDVSKQLQRLQADEATARAAEYAIGRANAPETEKVATDIMTQVDEITGRAASISNERGYAATVDIDHLKTARAQFDTGVDHLRQVPYCQK